jgi:hypothetical protein
LSGFVESSAVHGGALVLVGNPGTGKSVLVDAAANHAAARGTQVLRADGAQFETGLLFAGLDMLLRPLMPGIERLGPAQAKPLRVALGLDTGTPPSRADVADAVLMLLANASSATSLLLVVDDAQWLDRGTAGALTSVAKRLEGSRVGVLAAMRPEVKTFFDPSGLARLDLAPLADVDASALLRKAHPGLAQHVHRRVVEAAAGNPLALTELPRALTADQLAGASPLPSVLPLGPRLEALFATRVALLPPPARRLLLLAALERSGDVAVLQRAGGESFVQDLQAAEDAGLISVTGDPVTLTFRHPLVRSTVVEHSASGERQQCHRVLAKEVGDQERRVQHLAAAAERPDESVAALLESLAHKVLDRGDATGAVSALLRAAELTPDSHQRRERLAQAAFLSVAQSYEPRTAASLLTELERDPSAMSGSVNAAMTAALLLYHDDGDMPTCFALLARTMQEQGEHLDAEDPWVIEALNLLVIFCSLAQDADSWTTLRGLLGRLRPGAPALLRLVFEISADPGRASAELLAELEEAISALGDAPDPMTVERLGRVAVLVDRSHLLREQLWTVVHDARDREGAARVPAVPALMHLAEGAWFEGRWDEALQIADEGVEVTEQLEFQSGAWAMAVVRCSVAAGRGRTTTSVVRRTTSSLPRCRAASRPPSSAPAS